MLGEYHLMYVVKLDVIDLHELYSHEQWLFNQFVSKITNKLVK